MSPEIQNGYMKKGIEEAVKKDRKTMVIVAGGCNGSPLNSVEMFSPATSTWSLLQPMKERRQSPSSVIHNNQLFVTGGYTGLGWSKSIERLSSNDVVQADQSMPWKYFPAELPGRLAEHCTVVYNGRLILIGGYDDSVRAHSDNIAEISFDPPYTKNLLTTMPQRRCYHGVAIIDDKIFIVGGRENSCNAFALESVIMYDVTKNECQELAPLPNPVSEMATVKWGEDNVIIMGGAQSDGKVLSTVVMYNIKTQKSHVLPDMKYKRKGCVAVVVRDTVIVMGGQDETGKTLESVESFKFDRNSWQELPKMHEARYGATAVAW